MQYSLLNKINDPSDVRKLTIDELEELSRELRNYIIETLNICGGHFAANLGAIELTIALHHVFHTPEDKLIWDVGHQAYPHKVLTGRKSQLHTIKQADGLAPFPKREESIYDTFGVGHSSTSISAGLGMAIAAKMQGKDYKSVAIIGDGGLTGGMAFEALNHAGSIDADLLVILNDNDMSISPNVGALNNYLARILSGKLYTTLREGSKKVLAKMPPIQSLAKRTETHLKGMIAPGTLFEELGFHYFGPIDGHDLKTLVPMLENLKVLKGPQFLHVITTKGKGFAPAEADPVAYHAVKSGFNNNPTSSIPAKITKPTYSDVFGEWLCDMAKIDSKLYAITPAMCEGSGMTRFAEEFTERYCDVGIAEQHCVTFAAGMACQGMKPVVAIYSTFLQRGYDQLIHDVAIQNLDVTFALDRAGLVGADGPTHAGSFDLSYLRCIPNMIILAPGDEDECWQMLYTAYHYPGPAAVRYPRGSGPGKPLTKMMTPLEIGKGEIRRSGQRICLLAFGSMVTPTLKAGEHLDATVVNMRYVKPLDEHLLIQMADTHELIVTIEENAVMGGAGSGVNETLTKLNRHPPILNLGLPDVYIEHGNPDKMLSACGLDEHGIISAVLNKLSSIPFANTHASERETSTQL
ncbi:MAG: 1-deoxy-D-xylulose-5-phosphate synthase [Gammaproteobacteria bacterium]|nr:1-deoxy-D-xylulose-5-phosphate synthase [Gammaproteobacteria bacterium]